MPPVIEDILCNKCGICIDICPTDVIHITGDGGPVVRYPEECWHCNACKLDCASGAIYLRFPLPAMLLYSDGWGRQ